MFLLFDLISCSTQCIETAHIKSNRKALHMEQMNRTSRSRENISLISNWMLCACHKLRIGTCNYELVRELEVSLRVSTEQLICMLRRAEKENTN